ncbi:MFS transporter [Sphingopyxis sp. JAI128]|uniref:MFS transporter n=1 Tax=Sphingopyxis sp. JAI128 TaxID=2723066 RepID=UPI00160FA0F5|nr:MFS transporter [Sphingopyxis sp. JAI128]MBB6428166.1 MFS family permease [Sphingopyxis sp. JAI128]
MSLTDRLIMSALVDPMKSDLHLSDSAIGVLQGIVFAVVYACAGLVLGRAADRQRRLTILLVGATTWCLATIACGLATSYWQLVLARALVGIGEAALAPAAVSIVADSFPPARRGTATSVFFVGSYIGAPVSIAVGGVMLGLAQGGSFSGVPMIGDISPWRMVLVIVGVAGMVVPVLLLSLREPNRQDRPRAETLGVMIRHFVTDWRMLAPLYLAIGLMNIGDYGMFAWFPTVLSRQFAIPPKEIGQWFGILTAATGILGCLVAGPASDLIARAVGVRGRLFLPLAAALIASAGALLIAKGDAGAVFSGLALWVFFSAISNIAGIAALQAVIPSRYNGVGIALLAFCNVMLGLGLGPVLVPLVTEHVYCDPLLVGWAVATVAASAAILAALLFLVSSLGLSRRRLGPD